MEKEGVGKSKYARSLSPKPRRRKKIKRKVRRYGSPAI